MSIFSKPRYIKRIITVKGRFAELILRGRKTTTIRLGKVIPMSDELVIHSGGKVIAKIKVKRVRFKKIRELTDQDAWRDGFRSVKELVRSLRRVYRLRVTLDDIVTIIEFEVIEKLDIPTDKEYIYMGLEPREIATTALQHYKEEITEEEKQILEKVAELNSIRAAALKLYGNINKRWQIRKTLKKYLEKIVSEDILKKKPVNMNSKNKLGS